MFLRENFVIKYSETIYLKEVLNMTEQYDPINEKGNPSVIDDLFSRQRPAVNVLYGISAVFWLFAFLSLTFWDSNNWGLYIIGATITYAFALIKQSRQPVDTGGK